MGVKYARKGLATIVVENQVIDDALDMDPRLTKKNATADQAPQLNVGLLTGGQDRPYAFGLAMSLNAANVNLEVIGSDELDSPEFHNTPNLRFLNLRGNQSRTASRGEKVRRVLVYYIRLARYAIFAKPKIFHILWNNKFELFDRTLLMAYYKIFGRKIALTAHNVNIHRRDGTDSWINRISLKLQYHLVDHIFVHTKKMKSELLEDFGVSDSLVTVLEFPINDAYPETSLTCEEAKLRLGVSGREKTILFFGRIAPYKGLEHLVEAFKRASPRHPEYRLIIAGELNGGSEEYLQRIQRSITKDVADGTIVQRIQFIPDDEVEIYFKGADVLVLPYKEIFQSGVLFLAYHFGLPVIATDVGCFKDDIVNGKTGFVCKANNCTDLCIALETYFESELYANLSRHRQEIRDYAHQKYSWETFAGDTRAVYARLAEKCR